jgi:hypothetical protein
MTKFVGFRYKNQSGLWRVSWAWFIHFWQDALIFSFLAIGSVIPGG